MTSRGAVAPADVRERLERGEARLLDIREAYHREFAALPDAEHVPLAHLLEAPERAVLPGKPLILMDHDGRQAAFAARYLARHGIDAQYMAGGILGWASQVDPRVPRY